MFRPTQFVILFAAVFLCGYAAAADPESKAVVPKQASLLSDEGKGELMPTEIRTCWRLTNGLFVPCTLKDSESYFLGLDGSIFIRVTDESGLTTYYPLALGSRSIDWVINEFGQLIPRIFYPDPTISIAEN